MMLLKRGVFRGRRAQTEHEAMWTIAEMVFFSIFLITLMLFARSAWRNTTFEKNYLARDMAMTINTIYMAPQRLTFSYPYNASKYNMLYQGSVVRVGDAESKNKKTDRIYWFADEKWRRLDYMLSRIESPSLILYLITPSEKLVIISDNNNGIISPGVG